MLMDKLIGTQSIIITLDVDAFLFEKLNQIAHAGFSVVEINSVEQSLLKKVLQDFPMLRIGASNIINPQQLEDCYQAGAHFVTSPGFVPAIAQTAAIYSVNYIPGVATLSEAMQAIALGCQHVRPFPANLAFCTLLNKCLPLLRLFPGEIELEDAELFLNLPSVAAVSISNPEIKHLKALSANLFCLKLKMTQKDTLAQNSLGIRESIIMGVAGSAPAFSLSAVTATLIAAVSTLAPASVLYCGIIMFGITLAFIHLNKTKVNSGASYAWVSEIFGRPIGFLSGWALLMTSAVFMVSGSIPAATATLLFIAPKFVNNLVWVNAVAAIWLTAICLVILKGIKSASRFQMIMTCTELIILITIMILGFMQSTAHHAHSFSFAWLSVHEFTPHSFTTGALLAVFLFWGWDVTLNLNEETDNAKHVPGWGAFWSFIIIVLLLICFFITTLLVLTDHDIQQAGTHIIFTIADKLFPRPWSYLAVIAVFLSSIGTLTTTILQFSRTLFAMSRDGLMPSYFARIHPSNNAPWVGIVLIWLLGMIFLFSSSWFPTVNLLIQDSIKAIGFQVAFYYSTTGFACAWYYRTLSKSLNEWVIYVMWPIISSLFLIFIALSNVSSFDLATNVIGIGRNYYWISAFLFQILDIMEYFFLTEMFILTLSTI